MIQAVLDKIKSQFASLLLKVRLAIEAQPVKVENVHQFLVSFFQDDCSIPEVSDPTKLFNFITEAKLWRYATLQSRSFADTRLLHVSLLFDQSLSCRPFQRLILVSASAILMSVGCLM